MKKLTKEQRVHESLYRWLVRSAECRTIQGAKKIIPVLEKEIFKALTANTAEDEREVYPACSRCDLYLENGDDWREQASKLVDAYIKRVKEYQNQIAIGKIEEYKCEFPNSYDCHEVADDIIDWLQSENK